MMVVGARPQFVKAAVVERALDAYGNVQQVLVHTGQHYDANMSQVFFADLGIRDPDYNLAVGSGRHGEQTARMLTSLEQIMLQHDPDWVLVYGDTNSTLAAALAAAKLHLPVAHVEAGLRSYNRVMPEEINRVLTDHISDALFAPTDGAVDNLRREGIGDAQVIRTGDVMFDAAIQAGDLAMRGSRILERLSLEPKEYVLATVHRAENTDDLSRLTNILQGLSEVSRDAQVVMPLHPRTRATLVRNGLSPAQQGTLRLIDPVGYLDMITLERHARLVATDSGGVQKEAYFFSVPCVTLRDETEWTELVDHGWNVVVSPTSADAIATCIRSRFDVTGDDIEIYGDGHAGEQIASFLVEDAQRRISE